MDNIFNASWDMDLSFPGYEKMYFIGVIVTMFENLTLYSMLGIVRSYPSKKWENFFFRDCSLSDIKLYISVAASWKIWIETIKY